MKPKKHVAKQEHLKTDAYWEYNLMPLRDLHRHEDGYISFAVKSDDDFRPQVAILASELTNSLRAFHPGMSKDAFVSINAGSRLQGRAPAGKAHGVPKHRTATLRYLCACYADLDFDRHTNLSFIEVLKKVFALRDAARIPKPSAFVNSGRGLWLLWCLRDSEDPTKAQRAFPEKITLYGRIKRLSLNVCPALEPTQ